MEITFEEAIASARAEMGLDTSVAGHAWRIRRLDRPGDAYFLVVLGEAQAAVAVVTVGMHAGEIVASARLPGTGPHLAVDAGEALQLARLGENARAEMVWRPCRASLSPLYPLWEVRTDLETVYVDQQSKVWPALDSSGPGG